MDQTGIVGQVVERIGTLSDDEAALVRTLSPMDQPETAKVEHLLDLVDVLRTIRDDEAMAEYVYAIAPGWDSTIESLMVGGRVTTAFSQFELESCGAAFLATTPRVPARRRGLHRVPTPVG